MDNFGDLGAGTNNALASRIVHVSDILVLKLSTFPDLNFAPATEHTDAHGGEQVVGSVGVVVYTSIENRRSVLANGGRDEGLATRVVLDKIGDIVDHTSNSNKTLAILGLGDKVVPADDGELLQRGTPVKSGTLLVKLLLQLLNAALLNLVGTELLEIRSEAETLPSEDGPLGRVVLPPLNGVSVVGRKFVVEVVVALTKGDESGDEVVTGRVAVVEGLVTEPVSKRVDAESSLLNEADAQNAAIDKASPPVVEQKTTEQSRKDQTHEDDTFQIVLVLPDDDGVLVEIGDVGTSSTLGILLEHHPSQMRVEETLANRVGVLLSVGISVVSSVAARPPTDGTFNGTSTNSSKVDLERQAGSVRSVRPKTVVALESPMLAVMLERRVT